MIAREYQDNLLFMGILSSRGFPSSLKEKLEDLFGPIGFISESFPFTFTDYYEEEMGEAERFFLSFSSLVKPDSLSRIKTVTNELEMEYAEEGKRKINLDPGLLSEASVILATAKNRSHRIAIGSNLYAEVTLIYQNHGFQSLPWTYADYRSEKVQGILLGMRSAFLKERNLLRP